MVGMHVFGLCLKIIGFLGFRGGPVGGSIRGQIWGQKRSIPGGVKSWGQNPKFEVFGQNLKKWLFGPFGPEWWTPPKKWHSVEHLEIPNLPTRWGDPTLRIRSYGNTVPPIGWNWTPWRRQTRWYTDSQSRFCLLILSPRAILRDARISDHYGGGNNPRNRLQKRNDGMS